MWWVACGIAGLSLLAGCERPPIESVQHGFRGTAMGLVYNPRIVASQAANNEVPAAQPPASAEGPKAGQLYQNVKVLGDLSVAQFARHMVSITNWVAPNEGCTYCHVGANFADDSKYTKVVARRMIQMTQHINADWKPHVAQTGVTCFTCHRGQPVPARVWFGSEPIRQAGTLIGDNAGQNKAARSVADSSLPYDPFTPYLLDAKPIRVNGTTALPTGNRQSTKQAEFTYGLMMHMSDSLGVNCTYCHNSRAFAEWEGVPPQRATAWHGIRMARNLNNEYLAPLTSTFPPERLGPTGDVAKINCATCHQGAYKPLYGKSMLADHPELAAPGAPPADPAAAVAPATADQATLFFDVGSAALTGDATKSLAPLIEALKVDPTGVVTISGYHSAAGTLKQNQELAKQRAFAVRDAITGAGIDAARVKLAKPQKAEANLSGEDPQARRVEVAKK
jgi:photosynthetic reaction center cytochrome c subunit